LTQWSDAVPIIVPDAQDTPDTEFYAYYGIPYEGLVLGMLWNFRTTSTTIWPQFVFSRDGVHYDRRFRQPFIPLDAGHGFDSAAIYALQPIIHGDKVFVYYGGVNWRSPEHLEQLGEEGAHGAIGLAVTPLDGFVSLEGAKGAYSEVVTRSLNFAGKELRVNMRAAFQRWGAEPCDVRVEILGPDSRPIPGYGFEDGDPLATTGVANRVTWRGRSDVGNLAGKPVRLRFRFKNAKLFAFQFVG
jgi:hypothetical protein